MFYIFLYIDSFKDSNIKKSVHFLLSSNIGEILTILAALLIGFKTPLAPIQLLWINLVTDSLPAIALGLEPAGEDIMNGIKKQTGKGIFTKERLLDILKNFICFNKDGADSFKILAGYHQYFAVKKAIESTKHAIETDGRGGVFWHTQGSGKSLSMVFYAHLLQEALSSPTIVVMTDRNDLDNQLYGQFSRCKDFLRQTPVQATCRKLGDNP